MHASILVLACAIAYAHAGVLSTAIAAPAAVTTYADVPVHAGYIRGHSYSNAVNHGTLTHAAPVVAGYGLGLAAPAIAAPAVYGGLGVAGVHGLGVAGVHGLGLGYSGLGLGYAGLEYNGLGLGYHGLGLGYGGVAKVL